MSTKVPEGKAPHNSEARYRHSMIQPCLKAVTYGKRVGLSATVIAVALEAQGFTGTWEFSS